MITLWAIGAFILAANTTDVSGPATVHGSIHDTTAFFAFLSGGLGALLVSFSMPRYSPWGTARPPAQVLTILTGAAMLALFVGTAIPRIETGFFGHVERIFLGLAPLWMLVISVTLLRLGPA